MPGPPTASCDFPIADTAETVEFRKGERASARAVEQILAENVSDRSD